MKHLENTAKAELPLNPTIPLQQFHVTTLMKTLSKEGQPSNSEQLGNCAGEQRALLLIPP